MACSMPTSRSPPWHRSTECQMRLDREADELGKMWFGKYRVAIKGLTDERRAVYRRDQGYGARSPR